MNAEIISTLLMIVGGVTILTNIIVQVVKKHHLGQDSHQPGGSVCGRGADAGRGRSLRLNQWLGCYLVHGGGCHCGRLMSAYAAMFGFDKFKEVIQEWQKKI